MTRSSGETSRISLVKSAAAPRPIKGYQPFSLMTWPRPAKKVLLAAGALTW
jgi:hypothetical protein